ncbi:hypothetical protein O7A70_30815 [Mesorhizobium sp. Cs1299R1N1]|uniref:hypothetical protein n=1 Tax=Mesorhizobium sp. Cs1299R1N1 TaxID=3015172 RepID=UPI00301D6310
MASFLDDLKDDVSAALTGTLRSATYWQNAITGYDDYNQPVFSWTANACEGIRGSYDPATAGLAGIPRDHASIELLASSLAVEPDETGIIEIEGRFWQIFHVDVDPATAWWTCECAVTTDPSP